jgi:hypothetical protein
MKQRQYAQRRLSVGIAILSFLIGQVTATQIALGILFLIFLPLTLPMLNIDETTGKRLIDFFI